MTSDETLKAAAGEWLPDYPHDSIEMAAIKRWAKRGFISGARWQAEQAQQDESEAMKVAAQRAERIRELEAERDMARQEYHELEEFHRLYIDPYKGDDGGIEAAKSHLIGRLRTLKDQYRTRAKQAEAKLALIRETLSSSPACDKYDEGDAITCGWKRDMQAVRAILDGEET